ncbi:MAG: hypothetical protein AAGG81_08025, partial [Chlamydiota bacterium]
TFSNFDKFWSHYERYSNAFGKKILPLKPEEFNTSKQKENTSPENPIINFESTSANDSRMCSKLLLPTLACIAIGSVILSNMTTEA